MKINLIPSLMVLFLVGCGGGGGGAIITPPASPTITSVSVSCNPGTVQIGQNSQCGATVMGTGSYSSTVTWSAISGMISSSGLYTPPATVPASGSDNIKATSTEDSTKSGSFTLTVQPKTVVALQITTTSLTKATSGLPYAAALAATGGTGTGYLWSLTPASVNSLPTGFSLSTGGLLSSSGSPPASTGSYTFTVQAFDSANNNAMMTLTLAVQAQLIGNLPLQIITPSLPNATIGTPYSMTLNAEGGSGMGYTWAAPGVFSPLPTGFTLSTGGVLSSTSVSAVANTYVFPVQVTDSAGNTASDQFALIVQPVTPLWRNFYLTDLHDFGGPVLTSAGSSGLDGSYVVAGITFDSAGDMYGTAFGGGGNASYGSYDPHWQVDVITGMVWELQPSGTYKDLHDFAGTVTNANGASGPDGWGPYAGVTFDSGGNMYGTTAYGGPYKTVEKIDGNPGDGIVWEITAQGTYKDLHDFGGTVTNAGGSSGADGAFPFAGVTFDSSGNMYGTTNVGGPDSDGIVWEITAQGAYKDLHDFGGTVTNAGGSSGADGAAPNAGVTFDSSGNMYGTASLGGPNGKGMVWEITAQGIYKDLHDFGATTTNADGASGPDGTNPIAGVTLDADENMYGSALNGGANNAGMVWEITSGTYKDLHDFGGAVTNANGIDGSDGVNPYYGGVTLDDSGNIYGTTLIGGPYKGYALPYNVVSSGGGIVWEITASGMYKDLYDFYDGGIGQWGFWPATGVVLDKVGSIYGTTSGAYDDDAPVDTMVWKLTTASTNFPAPAIAPFGIVPVGSGTAVGLSIIPGQSATGLVTPGEWVSIYGSNLAGASLSWTGISPNLAKGNLSWTGDFPTTLGGTSVTVNGVGAFLSYVSPGQIILQVPTDIGSTTVSGVNQVTGPVSVVVTTPNGSATSAVSLTTFGAPSFLLLDDKHVAGIILRSDGSGAYGGGTYDIIGPTGNSLGYPTVAAKAGDKIVLFGVGFGPTTAGQAWEGSASQIGNGTDILIKNVEVLTGALPLENNGIALTGSGLFQISLTVPNGLGSGDLPLVGAVGVINLGAALTAPNVVISLQ